MQGVSIYCTPSVVWTGHAGCIHLLYTISSVDRTCMVYPSATQEVWTCRCSLHVQGVSLSTANSLHVQGVSLSSANSLHVQGVSLSSACNVDMHGVCIPLHRHAALYSAWCIPIHVVLIAGIIDWTARHPISPVSEQEEDPVWYQNTPVPD
jgi:hypothetical protein